MVEENKIRLEKETETEYKAMINKEQFNKLKDYFNQFAEVQPMYTQINYYFDTEDFYLINLGITVRIRFKNNNWELQVKIPEATDGEFNQQQEFKYTLTEADADELLQNGINENHHIVAKLLKAINFNSLKLIGSLESKRTDYSFYTDTISLDENTYLGVTDYELEWETNNHKFVLFEFNRLKLTPIKGTGKITRFKERLKAIN